MDYYGLVNKFKLNRPLNVFEACHRLHPSKSVFDKPWGARSVIKMNSTYLECVDKFFEDKGVMSTVGLYSMGAFIIAGIILIFPTINDLPDHTPEKKTEALYFIAFMAFIVTAVVTSSCFFLRKEFFRLTHYPIRFNRKNRMVYVFLLNGTVMAESWDKLFFTEGECGGRLIGYGEIRDVRVHRLAEDGETVLDTFALPEFSDVSYTYRFAFWEFVRRYMEEGPEKLMCRVPMINDVADRRETFLAGWNRHHIAAVTNTSLWFACLFSPLTFLFATSRWLAVRTCKIPVWPTEVEAACQVDPKDPYIIDRDHPPVAVDRMDS